MTIPQDPQAAPQQPAGMPPAYTPAPEQPSLGARAKAAGGRAGKQILIRLVVLVVLGVVAFVGVYIYNHVTGNADIAKAGDCVKQTGANDIQVVKCSDASAKFKVLAKIEDPTQAEADAN